MACLKMILAAGTGTAIPTLELARLCTEHGGYVINSEQGVGIDPIADRPKVGPGCPGQNPTASPSPSRTYEAVVPSAERLKLRVEFVKPSFL